MGEILVKTGNDYILYSKDKTVLGITSGTMEGRMLSLKNCQAIENGYDLDELAKSYAIRDDISDEFDYVDGIMKHFKAGLQKALELLGDKKFTEDDIRKTIFIVTNPLDTRYSSSEIISSLQPKEWDVEICCYIGNGDKESDSFKDPLVTNTGIPKLDKDGCLILRRK